MATSKDRERELARRRLERRQQRMAAQRRARRRNVFTVAGVIVLVVGLVALGSFLANRGDDEKPKDRVDTASKVPDCTSASPAAKAPQTFKSEPPLTVTSGSYTMAMQTNCGEIELALDAAKAPHTVNSLKFLADKGYYDGTKCHRLTTSEGLKVLQCGDPKGDGTGGPGYTIAEENLTGATYKRGTVAMAKTSAPHSTGSQFFLVIADSQLPPQYTPVGTITKGLDILDKVLAAGVEPPGLNSPDDGAPAQPVYLEKVSVAKA